MSGLDRNRSPDALAVDALVAEAKEHLDAPEVDWSQLEAKVMAAVEKETPALLRDVQREDASGAAGGRALRPRSRDVLLRAGAIVFAAAAAVALFVRKDRDSAVVDAARVTAEGAEASSLRSTEGGGEVRINNVLVTPGSVVRSGDAIDVAGARAIFERTRKVTWLLESDAAAHSARAHVKASGEPLVLGLEDGVIEAQVAPVSQGEAFAVDIATQHGLVRVAVHGTHLRVSRAGDHVAVDLTEGVVSIGVPPRIGVTYGTLVVAPAHVELDATDLRTLRVDHAPASVRAAFPLSLLPPPSREATPAGRPEAPLAPVPPPATPPPPPASGGKGSVARPVDIAALSAKPELPAKPRLPPREAIAAAVRDCAAARSRSGDVRVTITSNLSLRVSSAGEVEAAQFSPPLLPEIQSCAAQAIYKTKLDETGAITVPIEFSY